MSMNEAFFFGSGQNPVFANYHAPIRGSGHVLTVICPPLFHEYMLTQLALRNLAISLAETGQHVLRFDYRGTGDSSADLEDVSISDWVEDIDAAVREGMELSGSGVVRLVGIRASALLACHALGKSIDVQRFVLWDPVPNGSEYLQSLRRIQVELLERDLHLSFSERRETCHEFAGYRLSERMLEEFRLLDRNTYSKISANKLYVVSTSPEVFLASPVHHAVVPFTCAWETNLDQLITPKPVLERITACLTLS